MGFNPQNLGGTAPQNNNFGSVVDQAKETQDSTIKLNNQIYVDGSTADVYNDDEMFDRDRLISLGSIEFDRIEHEGLIDLFDAKVFEHKLDKTMIQEVYSRADLKNLGPQLEKFDAEIQFARNRLAAAKKLYHIIRNTERSFIDPERIKSIQRIFNNLTKERDENPLVKIPDELELDLIQTIHSITSIPVEVISRIPPTHLYMQLLDDLKQWFVEGGHVGLYLHPLVNRNDQFKQQQLNLGKLGKVWKLYTEEEGRKALFQIGLPKNNTGRDFVFHSRWNNRIPRKKLSNNILRVAQICSSLANEYRVSAGLGLVIGNKTAIKYGLSPSKSFPFHNMLGGKNVNYVSENDSVQGSLQDLAIVSSLGKLKQSHGSYQGATKVALFDGYVNTKKTGGKGSSYTDVRRAFLDNLTKNPRNNNMDQLDELIASGQQIFSEVSTLLENATCANQDLNLLTPQGLFIRVLEEFCILLKYQGFEGDEVARAEQLTGMHLLQTAKGTYTDHADGFAGILKFRLNTYVQRLIARRRNAKGVVLDKQVRLSSLEESKSFNEGLEEIAFDRRLVAEALIAHHQTTLTYGTNVAGIDHASGLLKDPHKFKNRFKEEVYKNETLNKQFNNVAVISGEDFLDVNRDIDGSEGFLRGIADIFEEMEKEAMKAAGESSYVNTQRITNLSGFDSALTTAMLLECFSLLADSFAKTWFILGVKENADGGLVATSDEEGDGLTDISFLQYANYVSALHAIRDTENAHEHIFGGSASDEFVAAFTATTTGAGLKGYYDTARQANNNLGKLIDGTSALANVEKYQNPMSTHEKNYLGTDNILKAAGYHGTSGQQAVNIVKDFDSPEAFIKHVATKLRNRAASQFATGRHVLLYETYQGDGRQTLLEIINAAKDGDLGQLFGDQNQKATTFLANENRVPYGTSMAKHDTSFTPAMTVEVINQLAISHVAPTRLFDVCRAMFMHLDDSTADVSLAAAALRSSGPTNIIHRGTKVEDPNEELQALVSLTKTKAGRRIVRGFSKRQLEIIEARIQTLEAADENQGYIPEILTDAVERGIRMYLDSLKVASERGKFVFYGIPAGKLERLIYNKNASKIDDEGYDSSTFSSFFDESFDDAELVLSIHPIDELQPEIKYLSAEFNFPLNLTVDDAGLAAAFSGEEQPKNFDQLARFCEYTIDSPFTSEIFKATGFNILPKYGIGGLKNVLASFLIKKLSKIAFSMGLSEEETVAATPLNFSASTEDRDRSSSATSLMKDLAAVFLPDPKLVTALFDAKPDLNFPSGNLLAGFMNKINAASAGTRAYNEEERSYASQKRELLISLYNTKPFFADSIEGHISRPSEFDYVFAVFVDHGDIKSMVNRSATEATPEGKTALEKRKSQGDSAFQLNTIHSSAHLRKRTSGEIL